MNKDMLEDLKCFCDKYKIKSISDGKLFIGYRSDGYFIIENAEIILDCNFNILPME